MKKGADPLPSFLRRNALTVGLGAVILFFVLSSFFQNRGRESQQSEGPVPNFGPPAGSACEPVQTFEPQSVEHLSNGTEFDDYHSSPGTSGPHWQQPAEPGYYVQDPLPPEAQLVHNLEHGQIVVFHDGLSGADETALLEYVKAAGGAVTAAPKDDLASRVALTAWATLQECDALSSEAITEFRRGFQGTGPEGEVTPRYTG